MEDIRSWLRRACSDRRGSPCSERLLPQAPIAEALRVNTTLREIDLRRCGLSKGGKHSLGRALLEGAAIVVVVVVRGPSRIFLGKVRGQDGFRGRLCACVCGGEDRVIGGQLETAMGCEGRLSCFGLAPRVWHMPPPLDHRSSLALLWSSHHLPTRGRA